MAHYALQVGANILVDSVRPLTYSQPTSTNRLSIILIISIIKKVVELVDAEGQKHIMEEVDSARYLGNIIQTEGKNKRNIQERKNRGLGAVNQIQQLLDDLCLGDYHFGAANILRNSLLISVQFRDLVRCNKERNK